MENKKLLKFLLNDLSELDEIFAEKGKTSFDDLEIEFIKSRVSGATRLVKLFLEKESNITSGLTDVSVAETSSVHQTVTRETILENKKEIPVNEINQAVKTPGVWVEETVSRVVAEKSKPEPEPIEKINRIVSEKEEIVQTTAEKPEEVVKTEVEDQQPPVKEVSIQNHDVIEKKQQKELHLDEEEEMISVQNKRLGDSFLKEKSVNDIMSDDLSKLEHKLSNRPVESIQAAIGINDRFQYIRELFEGSTDSFVKTVSDLDSMSNLKEAVDYLQANFKWKKNDSSLKFVNLVKRRFPNE